MTFRDLLVNLRACEDAKNWAKEMTIEEIVNTCHRGDWLLWLAKKIDLPIKPITLAKVRCAKTVIHLIGYPSSLKALEVAEKFALTDEVSLDDLRNAAAYAAADAATAYAADAAAAYAAADAATAYAADAAYSAADAAYSAAYAADAADAAYSAAYAAAAYAYAADAADAARIKNQKQTADICREILGHLIITKVNELLK
ncbi:MAG: hypothetical protein KA234_00500 [Saprospiraceae bacterium]|nr:hypothetical protein [Saprospiraceae bacterium]